MTDATRRRRWVIPAGQEAPLKEALVRAGDDAGCAFADAVIEERVVTARYRAEDEAHIAVTLAHPEAGARDGGPQVPRTPGSPLVVTAMAPEHAALSAALREALASLAGRFTWLELDEGPRNDPRGDREGDRTGDARDDSVDTELLALRIGLKPAIRAMAPRSRIGAMRAALEGVGLHVERRDREERVLGEACDVLCASPELGRAQALVLAERDLYDAHARGEREEEAKVAARIGELLGYPGCCIDAHVAVIRARTAESSDDFEMIRRAWVPRPAARLNVFLRAIAPAFVPFEPCTFDCPRALAYANEIAAALGREDAPALARLDALLALPVAAHPTGAVAQVALDPTTGAITSVTPIPRVHHLPLSEADRHTLEALVGRRADPLGHLDDALLFVW